MLKKERNSNLEILRIMAMLMIILIHFCSVTDLSFLGMTDRFDYYFGGGVVAVCNVGVSCFTLISGYFGMRFTIRKFLKLEFMLIMFSLIETAVLVCVFPQDINGGALLEQLIKSVIPFLSRKYWFYSCYMCVFIFSNYIQKFIVALSKNEFKILIITLLMIFSVAPSVFYFEIMQDAGKGLVQILMLYLVGRYIKMHQDISVSRMKSVCLLVILFGVNVLSVFFPLRIGGIAHSLCRDNSITNIIAAVILLYIFKSLKLNSKTINGITKYMFAVFALENAIVKVVAHLIDNSAAVRQNNMIALAKLAMITSIVFMVCIMIGWIRNVIFADIEDTLIDKVENIVVDRKGFIK